MIIKSASFVKGIVKADPVLENEFPQVAFIGRSNVGKSSTINAITHKRELARTSSYPGRTQQINLFLINESSYLVDLPGYGFTKTSKKIREKIEELIDWYFLDSGCKPKQVVLIIDALVGPTAADKEMLEYLESSERNIIIVANKIDKIKQSESTKKMKAIKEFSGQNKVIPFSSTKKKGIEELCREIL